MLPSVRPEANSATSLPRRRRLALSTGRAVALISLLLGIVWLWAQTERQTMEVIVTPDRMTVSVDGTRLASHSLAQIGSEPRSGGVGLMVTPKDESGSSAPPDLDDWLDGESTWASVKVYSNHDGRLLLNQTLPSGQLFLLPWAATVGEGRNSGDYIDFGDESWSDYTVRAEFLRGREPIAISLLTSAQSRETFVFRPGLRDGAWFSQNGPLNLGPNDGVPYRAYKKSLESSLQEVARLLLRAYPPALVLLLLGLAGLGKPKGSEVKPVRRDRLALLIVPIVAVALLVGAIVATDRLERIPHVQDSVAYLFQAKIFAGGHLSAPEPPLPEFFEHEFIPFKDGRWFSMYTPGHPFLLMLGVLAGTPWLVSPIAGALSILVIFLIARRLYGTGAGLISAILGIFSPFFIFLSGSMMSHSTGLLFVSLFVWLFSRREHRPSALFAGAALGMALLIRSWTAGLCALPFAVVAIYELARSPKKAFLKYLPMGLGFLPFFAIALAWNYFQTGSILKTGMELWWPQTLGFGPEKGLWGHSVVDGLWNTSRNLNELLVHLFGWSTILTLVFPTYLFISGRARRSDLLFLGGFLAVVVGYIAWWADGIMFGPRFYFESLGFLLVLSARGVSVFADSISASLARLRGAGRIIGRGVSAWLVVILIGVSLTTYLPRQWRLYYGYNYVNRGPQDAVERSGISNALVFAYTGQWYEWWHYGMVFSANSPFLDTPVIYARDLGDTENRKLMALYPNRQYYRLTSAELTRIYP